jgi:uncharacterized protein (DUF2336 family)
MSLRLPSTIDPEVATQPRWQHRRIATLKRVTTLFVEHADCLDEIQIDLFDDVFRHLIKRAPPKALEELSRRLAPFENAPRELIRQLALSREIAVAGPVLAQSGCLSTGDLVEIANTSGATQLLAMSGRTQLNEFVTDALLQRSDIEADRRLAGNSGARFSEAGLSTLIERAENDGSLAEKIGSRRDIPLQLLRRLVLAASDTVRARLADVSNAENQVEIKRVLSLLAVRVRQQVAGRDQYPAPRHRVS